MTAGEPVPMFWGPTAGLSLPALASAPGPEGRHEWGWVFSVPRLVFSLPVVFPFPRLVFSVPVVFLVPRSWCFQFLDWCFPCPVLLCWCFWFPGLGVFSPGQCVPCPAPVLVCPFTCLFVSFRLNFWLPLPTAGLESTYSCHTIKQTMNTAKPSKPFAVKTCQFA